MDTRNGNLYADINDAPEDAREFLRKVPKNLHDAARVFLGNDQVKAIPPNMANNLGKWAKNMRNKNRIRAKIAKRSRKGNRK